MLNEFQIQYFHKYPPTDFKFMNDSDGYII